jgi:hypothetical protein
MQRSAIVTIVLAVAAHVGYYAFTNSADRAWFAYVSTGALLTWIGWRDRQQALAAISSGRAAGLALFAGTYILLESAQVAVCGALAWGLGTQPERDLCVQLGGETAYSAGASLLVAALWAWRGALWPSRSASQK